MFERDKNELRELGVPLETGRRSSFDAVDGYRIARQDYELGEIDLEPDEAAAVALAARLWDSPELAEPGARRAGQAARRRRGGRRGPGAGPAAGARHRPGVRPAAGRGAGRPGRQVRPPARRRRRVRIQRRTVEPWGVVSWRGRWYLVGHDRDRDAPRSFRVSRISEPVTPDRPGRCGRRARRRRPDGDGPPERRPPAGAGHRPGLGAPTAARTGCAGSAGSSAARTHAGRRRRRAGAGAAQRSRRSPAGWPGTAPTSPCWARRDARRGRCAANWAARGRGTRRAGRAAART